MSEQVLFITSELPPDSGGIGVYVQRLASELRRRNWDCWTAVWSRKFSIEGEQRIIRIPFFPFPPFGDHLFAALLRTAKKELGLMDAIINVHSPYAQAATGCDMLTVHTVVKHWVARGAFSGWKKAQYKIGFRTMCKNEERLLRAPIVCAVSQTLATQLRQEYGTNREVQVVGNAVDASTFVPGEKSEKPVVLFAGRLDVNKGVMDFVNAAKMIHRLHPTAEFHIVGTGPAEDLIAREIRRLGIEECTKLLGFVRLETLVKEYQQAWIYVLPTRFEGLATTILEAMACGDACIASDIPNNREVLTEDEGILVAPGSIGEYAKQVSALLSHPQELTRLGRNAREKVLHHFTWNRLADEYIALLAQLVA